MHIHSYKCLDANKMVHVLAHLGIDTPILFYYIGSLSSIVSQYLPSIERCGDDLSSFMIINYTHIYIHIIGRKVVILMIFKPIICFNEILIRHLKVVVIQNKLS